MFKTSVLAVDSLRVMVGKLGRPYTRLFLQKLNAGKTRVFAQFLPTPIHQVLHIKFRLNTLISQGFSTVSTQPIIKTTNLIFNKLVIKSARS